MAAYRSWFSYNVTRPYPMRWMTPVVVAAAVVAVALVSFLNVAATGYDLTTITSQDPDAAEAGSLWFSRWPSFLVGARASCEPANLPLQTALYTNNSALAHVVTSVWRFEGDGTKTTLGSLIYKNSMLQRCNVTGLTVQIEGPNRAAAQLSVSMVGGTVMTRTDCYVETTGPESRVYFELLSTFDAIPPPEIVSSSFLQNNKTENLSLYWGHALLSVYWRSVMQAFYDESTQKGPGFRNGVFQFRRNPELTGPVTDQVVNTDFFSADACWLTPFNATGLTSASKFCDVNLISKLSQGTSDQKPMPSIWDPINVLGKAMWFTVLSDLGRNDDDMPNMLARPALLEALSSDIARTNSSLRSTYSWGLDPDVRMLTPFDAAQTAEAAQLRVDPAVLNADYVCRVPRLKPGGTLFVSVLVADLVILQALWKVFKLLINWLCIDNTEEAESCARCGHNTTGHLGLAADTKYTSVSQAELTGDYELTHTMPPVRHHDGYNSGFVS